MEDYCQSYLKEVQARIMHVSLLYNIKRISGPAGRVHVVLEIAKCGDSAIPGVVLLRDQQPHL